MTKPRKHMTPAERRDCLTLWRAGKTLDELAYLFNRERSTISTLIRKAGAQKRRAGRYANKELLQ